MVFGIWGVWGCSIGIQVHTGPQPTLSADEVSSLVRRVLESAGGGEAENPFGRFRPEKTPEELVEERRALLRRLARDKGAPAQEGVEELLSAGIAGLTDEVLEELVATNASHSAGLLLGKLGAVEKDRQALWIETAYKLDAEACR